MQQVLKHYEFNPNWPRYFQTFYHCLFVLDVFRLYTHCFCWGGCEKIAGFQWALTGRSKEVQQKLVWCVNSIISIFAFKSQLSMIAWAAHYSIPYWTRVGSHWLGPQTDAGLLPLANITSLPSSYVVIPMTQQSQPAQGSAWCPDLLTGVRGEHWVSTGHC